MGGEIALNIAALAANDAGQALADLQVFIRPALLYPQAPLKAEREAHVDELKHIEVVAGFFLKPCQKVIEPITAHRFAVECAHHGLQPPRGLPAPRRVQHHVIQRRTERVARDLDGLRGDTRLQRAVLKGADFGDDRTAQLVGVHVLRAVADTADERKERRRRGGELVHARQNHLNFLRAILLGRLWRGGGCWDADGSSRRWGRCLHWLGGHSRSRRCSRWRSPRRATTARIGADHCLVCIIGFCKRVVV